MVRTEASHRGRRGWPIFSGPMGTSFDRLKAALADRYTLEREIGAGGMAKVYLAHDPRHNRKVAIKVMHPELAASSAPSGSSRRSRPPPTCSIPTSCRCSIPAGSRARSSTSCPTSQGESLRSRLKRETQLPVADAVRIAERDRGRARLRPPPRRDPPRHQAGQRAVPRRPGAWWPTSASRSPGATSDAGSRADQGRRQPRHAALHEPRAGRRASTISIRGPTSTRSAWCCTRCWPASRRSPAPPCRRSSAKVMSEEPRPLDRAPQDRSRPTSTPPSRARSRSFPPIAGRRPPSSPRR